MLYGGTCIKLRFSNGMTMEILKRLIVNYLELIKQEAIHEEELTWLHSFVL